MDLESRREALRSQVESCLLTGRPHEVNLQIPRHAVITPVLRWLVYEARFAGKLLPVVFTDGSHPKPFPAGVLRWPPSLPLKGDDAHATRVLKLGLMSMRHPDLDYLVDMYVCRNNELSRDDVADADKESLAFSRAQALLADSAFERGGEIWAFHTGFEPMIVGFYRAVVSVTLARRAKRLSPLIVRPWILRRFGQTKHYSPESRGAKLGSYQQLSGWA